MGRSSYRYSATPRLSMRIGSSDAPNGARFSLRKKRMNDQEPLKIVIPVEEELPAQAEQERASASGTAVEAGRKIAGVTAGLVQKAAQSDAGRAAARKAQELGDRGVRYVGTRMADTAEEQARATVEVLQKRAAEADWEKEVKSGLAAGLGWVSGRLGALSERFANEAQEKSPADEDQPGS